MWWLFTSARIAQASALGGLFYKSSTSNIRVYSFLGTFRFNSRPHTAIGLRQSWHIQRLATFDDRALLRLRIQRQLING